MDLPIAIKLITEEVQSLIELLSNEEEDLISLQTKFRNFLPPKVAQAAGELVDLRRRARMKFSQAATMFFTREALEVASSEVIAGYHAERMKGLSTILDACCGIGGDTIALARIANVLAADRDPVLTIYASENAKACGVSNLRFYAADFNQIRPPADGLFLDPARREGRKRARLPEDWSPAPACFAELVERYSNVAIKASPTVEPEAIAPEGIPCESEFLSYRRECRELILWFGDLRSATRRATILEDDGFHTIEGTPDAGDTPEPVEAEPGGWIIEPDPALIRSGLLGQVAAEHSLAPLDPEIAYMVGPGPSESPFLRSFEILDCESMDRRKVRAMLRRHGIGKVTVKKRGHPSDSESLRRTLANREAGKGTLIVTRIGEKHLAYLVRPAGESDAK